MNNLNKLILSLTKYKIKESLIDLKYNTLHNYSIVILIIMFINIFLYGISICYFKNTTFHLIMKHYPLFNLFLVLHLIIINIILNKQYKKAIKSLNNILTVLDLIYDKNNKEVNLDEKK